MRDRLQKVTRKNAGLLPSPKNKNKKEREKKAVIKPPVSLAEWNVQGSVKRPFDSRCMIYICTPMQGLEVVGGVVEE